ncbi:SURF4-domain-containing protein [Backusella circina FSU 941]|nr:SURF4-domain-containing protein [Backusella circina FSU 941]
MIGAIGYSSYNAYNGYNTSVTKSEMFFERLGKPIKPYLAVIGRFLVIATFYEDALRIVYQWSDQLSYLVTGLDMGMYTAPLYLSYNVFSMVVFSSCILLKSKIGLSVVVLVSVIISQAVVYRLLFNIMFLLRSLSVTGGLLLCMSESILRRKSKSTDLFLALPQLCESNKHKYFQLAGRVLLVFLFFGFMLNGEWNMVRAVLSCIGLIACAMVIVGFQAKWSATFLMLILCSINFMVNNWWDQDHSEYQKDFLRYDFFQCLSIMGGFLLLVSIGPGGISYDEKKKKY